MLSDPATGTNSEQCRHLQWKAVTTAWSNLPVQALLYCMLACVCMHVRAIVDLITWIPVITVLGLQNALEGLNDHDQLCANVSLKFHTSIQNTRTDTER